MAPVLKLMECFSRPAQLPLLAILLGLLAAGCPSNQSQQIVDYQQLAAQHPKLADFQLLASDKKQSIADQRQLIGVEQQQTETNDLQPIALDQQLSIADHSHPAVDQLQIQTDQLQPPEISHQLDSNVLRLSDTDQHHPATLSQRLSAVLDQQLLENNQTQTNATNQTETEQKRDPVAEFLIDFLEWKKTTSTILYYNENNEADSTPPPLHLDSSLTRRIQQHLCSYVTLVPLESASTVLPRLGTLAQQSTTHVVLDDGDASVELLSKMRDRCAWEQGGTCLILSSGDAATEKLVERFVPIDNEVMVAEVRQESPSGTTTVDLVEVYHLAGTAHRDIVARWKEDESFNDVDERSIFVRRGDWQGLQLRVTTIQDPPYTVLANASHVISGIVGNVWSQLADALNFTYTVQRAPDGQFGMLLHTGNWTGLMKTLVEGQADVAVSAVGVSNQRKEYVDFTHPIVHHWKHVFMNKPTGGDPISGAFLFVFHWTLLLALALCTVVGWWAMAALYWAERHYGLTAAKEGNYGLWDCLVIAMCAVFQQGPDYNPDGLGSRFLLWTLFVAMFMINASYSAVLTSYLAIKNEDVPIKNFDEFLQDGSYTLALRNNTIYVEDFKTANKRTLQRIFEKHVEVMSDDDVIQQRMKTDDKLAFFKFHTGAEDCSLFSFRAEQFSPVLAMALQNNSPYRIFFNYHLSRLDEGGILDRLDRQWTYVPVGDQCQDSNEVVAGLPTVFTAFTALGVGVAISVAILAAEIIWFRRKRDRARARELLLRWGGGALVHPEGAPGAGAVMGARRHRSEGAAVPWKPAQAVARFKGKETTVKTGLFLQRVQKLQEQSQWPTKGTSMPSKRQASGGRRSLSTDYGKISPTENSRLLEGDGEGPDTP